MTDRQLDIMLDQENHAILDRSLPGVLTGIDFIHFRWGPEIDPSKYTVIVESLDTAGPTFRSISKLNESVELPHVMFAWHPRLGVIPNSKNLPAFEGEMYRGSTYLLRSTHGKNGRFQLEHHGTMRPPGN